MLFRFFPAFALVLIVLLWVAHIFGVGHAQAAQNAAEHSAAPLAAPGAAPETAPGAAPNPEKPAPNTEKPAPNTEKPVQAGVAPANDRSPAREMRELWTGKLYSSTYRAGLCMPETGDGDIRGVLLLRLSSGKVDVYHFNGRTEGGRISLRHGPSGHTFKGKLDDADEVSGEIRLKSGFTVQLKGKRRGNAELSADTCRPSPE